MRTVIGIDPAFREKGIGFCELEGNTNTVTFRKKRLSELLNEISAGHYINAIVVVENSNLQNASFDISGNKKVVARKSRNAGANQATSEIICRMLDFKCHKLHELSPKGKGSKWLDNSMVLAVAKRKGWTLSKKRLSQDDRDAFKLMLYGLND